MLQLEEDKALRKIEETRKKAMTIIEIRMTKQPRRHSRADNLNTNSAIDESQRPMTPEVRSNIFFERKEEHRKIIADRLSVIL